MSFTSNWKRHGKRCYIHDAIRARAYVFGCSRPIALWAWVVYWEGGGKAAGVERGFRKAQSEADNCTLQVELGKMRVSREVAIGPEADKLNKANARMAALSALFGAKI